MTKNNIVDIMRAIIYLWVVFEGIFLTLLYKMAWSNMKRSNIILSLHLIFLAVTMLFVGLTILPVVKILDGEVYLSLTPFLIIPAFVLGFALRNFRINSLKEDMPKQPIKVAKKIKEATKNGKQS